MHRLIIAAFVAIGSLSFIGPIVAHEEAPSAACNMGTHHAHHMVPEVNGSGAEVKAHDNIPEAEDHECVHEAHE